MFEIPYESVEEAFVVTILKDRWTKSALSSLGMNERQIVAVEHVKANGSISSGQYVSLTGVPRRTAIRELQRLVAAQVFVARGEGKFLEYVLKIDCATSVPIVSSENAVHRKKSVSANKIKGQTQTKGKSTLQESGTDTQETSPQSSPQNLSAGARSVLKMVAADDQMKTQAMADELGVSKRMVLKYIKELASIGLHFEGPTKKGRWVFDTERKGGAK